MINELKLQEKIGFHPHQAQQQVLGLYDKSREIVLAWGRRAGKSIFCAYLVIRALAQNLYDLREGKDVRPIKIWIVAPTYELTGKIFEYLIKFYAALFPSLVKKTVSFRPFPTIRIPGGPRIECKSAENPTSLLGEEVDLLIVDEAARIKREIYESYLMPTLAMRKGKAVFISTPWGQNWFWQKYQQNPDSRLNVPSIANLEFPKDEWERQKKLLPEQIFKQEYEASFMPDAASVFRGVREIIKDDILKDVALGHSYIMGVDLGKHEDFTVLTIINLTDNHVVYHERFNKIDYAFQRQRIIAATKRYLNARVIVDSTSVGEPIKEDLEREGLFIDDFKFSNKSKKELIEKCSIFIQQKHVWIPNIIELIDELESFGYELSESGNIIYRAPTGLHDDCVISLALAIWGLIPGEPQKLEFPKFPKKPTSFI